MGACLWRSCNCPGIAPLWLQGNEEYWLQVDHFVSLAWSYGRVGSFVDGSHGLVPSHSRFFHPNYCGCRVGCWFDSGLEECAVVLFGSGLRWLGRYFRRVGCSIGWHLLFRCLWAISRGLKIPWIAHCSIGLETNKWKAPEMNVWTTFLVC